ncbi:zinc metallopeptidase [Stieleria sp. TO1_6]|uniref:KPN_02809 family neutral zinc metallopeptidase n=1 Tax=Stieleria tagensis TaxID=2956795 RepID=UPI00209B7ADF|nr:neutral zinc metallopeptidase [Stieleria tagensis]MCO8120937.1 zinc metallopeptidase [Stieleria tagensis]
MRWRGREQSSNVEDRRRSGGAVAVAGGGIGLLIMVVLYALLGGNPQQLLQQQAAMQQEAGGGEVRELTPEEQERGDFAKVVLKDTEDVWSEIFAENGERYQPPSMVLFSGSIRSACGGATSASGPFYCPADQKVYLDTSFFTQLAEQLHAPGDFAQAYVIAHEVGHHVQNLLGKTNYVDQIRQSGSKVEANAASVRLELQADFYAGVMLNHAQRTKQIIEPGDVEEALKAATAIGDDRLQKQSQGYVVPESFTHGTSEQRLHWFMKGLQTGDITQGDTFSPNAL